MWYPPLPPPLPPSPPPPLPPLLLLLLLPLLLYAGEGVSSAQPTAGGGGGEPLPIRVIATSGGGDSRAVVLQWGLGAWLVLPVVWQEVVGATGLQHHLCRVNMRLSQFSVITKYDIIGGGSEKTRRYVCTVSGSYILFVLSYGDLKFLMPHFSPGPNDIIIICNKG